jgi:hypothetical protein
MKLIIAGSRTVDPSPSEIDAAFDPSGLLFNIGDVTEVVSGRAMGADAAGENWARLRGIPIKEFPITNADRIEFGPKIAPKMRNRRMAEYGEMALVFWDGISGGSADMATRMLARDKPVRVIPTKKRK